MKNRIIKDLKGNIVELVEDGVLVVRKRAIVNQEAWNKRMQKIKDRQEAAKAASMAKPKKEVDRSNEVAEKIASQNNERIEQVEKDVSDIKGMLEKISEKL